MLRGCAPKFQPDMRHTDVNALSAVSEGAVKSATAQRALARDLQARRRDLSSLASRLARANPAGPCRWRCRRPRCAQRHVGFGGARPDLRAAYERRPPAHAVWVAPVFIDGLSKIGDVSEQERTEIESRMAGSSKHRAAVELLAEAGEMLSGLSRAAPASCWSRSRARR